MRWPEYDPNEVVKSKLEPMSAMSWVCVGKMATIKKASIWGPSDTRKGENGFGRIVAIKRDKSGMINNCLLLNWNWKNGHSGNFNDISFGAPDADYPTSHWWVEPQYLVEGWSRS